MINGQTKSSGTGHNAAIGIAQQGRTIRAIKVQLVAGRYEIVHLDSAEMENKLLGASAAKLCDLHEQTKRTERCEKIATGFDSEPVLFQRLCIPSTDRSELEKITKLQAEAQMPLPAEQMQTAWRLDGKSSNYSCVTVAAARRDNIQRFVDSLRPVQPDIILLDSEAIVRAWQGLFGGHNREAVIMSIGMYSTKLCKAENGLLIDSATIDIGTKDFGVAVDSEQYELLSDRFVQDLQSLLGSFGVEEKSLAVNVLSDGGELAGHITQRLNAAGIEAVQALPDPDALVFRLTSNRSSEQIIYEYRICLGLAMIALDSGYQPLDIFGDLYKLPLQASALRPWNNLKAACAAAVVAVLALLLSWYLADIATLRSIEKSLNETFAEQGLHQSLAASQLFRNIAQNRPDILELLSLVNPEKASGITLDSFEFTRHKPVTLKGQADNSDKLYEFQNLLRQQKGLSAVNIQNTSPGEKGKVKFTVTTHYRKFTSRKNKTGS